MSWSFPAEYRTRVDRLVGEYANATVREEWSMLPTGGESARVGSALRGLYRTLGSFEPATPGQTNAQRAALQHLDEVHQARHDRLDAARDRLATPLMALIWTGGGVILAFSFFFGLESIRAHRMLIALLSIVLGFSLSLVVILDNPFSGSIKIPTRHFQEGDLKVFFKPQ